MANGESSSGASDLVVGRWRVQPKLNQISDGRTIRHLEPQVMDLLVFLASTPGRLASKDEIIQAVWAGRFIADATLTRSIADLRRALGDTKQKRHYIETIAKRGYRLVATVSAANSDHRSAPASDLAKHGARSTARPAPSLVVLPFTNLGSADQRYFCEGLTEEIINVLTRIAGVRVISRTSAFAAHSQGGDVAAIGRRLGVTHVIEGSIRQSTGRLRVTAQLIRVSDHGHVWSERYDRMVSDVFAIQDEIAAAIAERLELTLGEIGRRSTAPTGSMEAHSRYLEGRHHFLRGTRESLERARRCYMDAIALDPSFAVAHDALSELLWYLGFYGLMVPKDAFTLAVWESLRALEIDDRMAESHALLAMLRKELDYDWVEVDREFALARALDPRSPLVRMRYAMCGLMPHGRTREAAAELERVAEADPLSIFVLWWLAVMYWFAGDLSRMRAQVERMIAVDPAHPLTHMASGSLGLSQGELTASIAAFESASELAGRPPWLVGWLGLACGLAGRLDRARALREELLTRAAGGYVPPSALALIALGLGDIDETFRCFEQAIDVRDPHAIPVGCYPVLASIRSDPRYDSLLVKMNLAGGATSAVRHPPVTNLPPAHVSPRPMPR